MGPVALARLLNREFAARAAFESESGAKRARSFCRDCEGEKKRLAPLL